MESGLEPQQSATASLLPGGTVGVAEMFHRYGWEDSLGWVSSRNKKEADNGRGNQEQE